MLPKFPELMERELQTYHLSRHSTLSRQLSEPFRLRTTTILIFENSE